MEFDDYIINSKGKKQKVRCTGEIVGWADKIKDELEVKITNWLDETLRMPVEHPKEGKTCLRSRKYLFR